MRTVLVVDDEVVAVRAIKRRVDWASLGIGRVLEANSMKQAMSVFESEAVDVLLCDIEMPEGTGLELFEWVKGYFPYVECIYVTCHPDFEYIRKAMRLGSLDYILKPIDYEELEEVMKKAIARSDANAIAKKHVHEKALKNFSGDVPEGSSAEIVKKVKAYVKEHLSEEISMEDIAEVIFLNPQYMVRLFKKQEGISILEYITNERIHLATELLSNTDDSVYQIAGLVGYPNYSYFGRVFKKVMGYTPQEYKKLKQPPM